jgi:hypothetical protein
MYVVNSDGLQNPTPLDTLSTQSAASIGFPGNLLANYDVEPYWSYDGNEIVFTHQYDSETPSDTQGNGWKTDGLDILPVSESPTGVAPTGPSTLYLPSPAPPSSGQVGPALYWPQFSPPSPGSPEDSQILYTLAGNPNGAYDYDLFSVGYPTPGTPLMLTSGDLAPEGAWSPDGSHIAVSFADSVGSASTSIGVINSNSSFQYPQPLPGSNSFLNSSTVDYVRR